jgi:phosphoglycolate phosphatase-like HAD superfamily hydrolase
MPRYPRSTAALVGLVAVVAAHAADPLPSWNEGSSKQAILAYVARVTKEGQRDFVAPDERIAVFDNDGTLWSEQPMYFQLAFALDRLKSVAHRHPEWRLNPPFRAALEGDLKTAVAEGEKAVAALAAAAHAGLTTEEYDAAVRDWVKTARHPRFNRPYTDLVYQPMLEVLAYLRANGFKPYIVSGGGVDFLRVWAPAVYGIPPEQIVGSSGKTRFEVRHGKPVLVKLPEIDFIDDHAGKPVGIHKFIGRRPVMAFGNSDGDYQMLQWTTAGGGPRFGLLVHHTDGEREWAYDRKAHAGKLAKALDDAPSHGWVVVDMKRDWKKVYAFER